MPSLASFRFQQNRSPNRTMWRRGSSVLCSLGKCVARSSVAGCVEKTKETVLCYVTFGRARLAGPVGLVLVLRLPPSATKKEHAMRAVRRAGLPSPSPRTRAGGRRSPDGDTRSVGRFDKTDLATDGRTDGRDEWSERRCEDRNAARERFRLSATTRDGGRVCGS